MFIFLSHTVKKNKDLKYIAFSLSVSKCTKTAMDLLNQATGKCNNFPTFLQERLPLLHIATPADPENVKMRQHTRMSRSIQIYRKK